MRPAWPIPRGLERARGMRGFTLLEAVLAAAIAAMVLLAGLTLLTTLQRNDRTLARRADETAELQRLRLVMQRAFSSMLMHPPVAGAARTNVARPIDPTGQPGGDERAQALADARRALEEIPPRVILELDPLMAGVILTRREADGQVISQPAQRLEVVLTDPPVPTERRDPFVLARAAQVLGERAARNASPDANDVPVAGPEEAQPVPGADPAAQDEDQKAEENEVRAVRGVFELRDQPVSPGQLRADGSEADRPVYELWWIPLTARRTVEEIREMGREQAMLEQMSQGGAPVRVASHLTMVRWRMFDDRDRKDAYVARVKNDEPAYVEMDVETRSGLRASWLFEVSTAMGPETARQAELGRQRREQAAADRAGEPGAGARTDARGAAGGARQPAASVSGNRGAAIVTDQPEARQSQPRPRGSGQKGGK